MPVPFISPQDSISPFPPLEEALIEPNGLIAAGGNLHPSRLVSAYQNGIFPWYEKGEPILWWSPDPRCVLWPDKIRIRRSLKKTLRKGHFRVTRNLAFHEVMLSCAAPRAYAEGTWISDDMINAYRQLYKLGIAESIEVWIDDSLVGGLYGVRLGSVFIGESMFSFVSDASKVALVHLAEDTSINLIDCQLATDHLMSMGAEDIPRDLYIHYLKSYGELKQELLPENFYSKKVIMV